MATSKDAALRSKLIRLAHAKPELRPHLLPLLKGAAGKVEDSLAAKLQKLPGVQKAVVVDTSNPSSNVVSASFEIALGGVEKSVQTRKNGGYSKRFVSFKAKLGPLRKAIEAAAKEFDAYGFKHGKPARKSEPKDKDGTGPLKYYDTGTWEMECTIPLK